MVSQQLRDMSQMTDIFRKIKRLNLEKEKMKKNKGSLKKDKGPYMNVVENKEIS